MILWWVHLREGRTLVKSWGFAKRAEARKFLAERRDHVSDGQGYLMNRRYPPTNPKVRAAALRSQGGRCWFCFGDLDEEDATAEHKKPKKEGGANDRENIAAAHLLCNRFLDDLPLEEKIALRGDMMPRSERRKGTTNFLGVN